MIIKIPDEVKYIIDTLESNGYDAYAVGGCVRDSILGSEPKDWDICTPALPEQTIKYFAEYNINIIETGLKHGTVTLILNHKPFEVTTYRIDGVYSDNRRPDKVRFVNDLKSDLSRRDFTVNSMAYNPKKGLADFFGGEKDLKAGIIRCVGDADKRFQEDALRIMRAMRFAAVLGFEIDYATSKAMFDNKKLLHNIASERIAVELNKMIVGNNIKEIFTRHISVIGEIIPEILPAGDLLQSTLAALSNAPADVAIRLAVLFRDCGDVAANKILSRLKYDNYTKKTVAQLILYRGEDIQPEKKHIKRWLNKIGEERFRQLLEIKRAESEDTDNIEFILNEIITRNECFSLKDLAVNGGDLIASGIPEGSEIGVILDKLLDMVINGQIENNKIKLLEPAEKLRKNNKI